MIAKFREHQGSGVQNYCHIGHIGERCATCDVVDGHQLEKGADGLCHYCEKHSVWILTRGDLGAVFAYYIPYNLFMRSGSPDKLKSAMMASFMFFVQTVTLLATSDTGQATWFMSTKYVQDEGQSDYQKCECLSPLSSFAWACCLTILVWRGRRRLVHARDEDQS